MHPDFSELVARVADEAARRAFDHYADAYGFGQIWLDEKQAARLLSVAPKTLEAMRRTGKGPAFVKEGRLVRYPRAELEAWARSHALAGGGR